MITAFCPGHITCFFQPISSLDPMSAGSRGAGIRLSYGTRAKVKQVPGNEIIVKFNDGTQGSGIIEKVIRMMDPTGGYDVHIGHDLPAGQGFGMSAADAVSVALCMCQLVRKSIPEGYRAAHVADLLGGGGRGDVAGIIANCQQPVRTVAGIPPFGRVEDLHVTVGDLTLAVLGPPLKTGEILSDRDTYVKIRQAGSKAMDEYLEDPSLENLFLISNRFSSEAGLMSYEMAEAIKSLEDRGFMASMCMLGNSIFTNAPVTEARPILGDICIPCSAVSEAASVIRTK